jgi:O-antigen/teichoic acid export membrane protein
VISLILSVVIFLLAYAGSIFFRDDGVRQVLVVLSVTPLLGIASFLPAAQLEREGRFKEISLSITMMNAVSAAATIILAMLGFRYMSLAYANVLSAICLSLMFIMLGREHFSCRLGFGEWRRVASFGFQMIAVTSITTLSQRLSDMMMGRIISLAALGLYNRASGLNNMIWGNVHSLASRVVLVDFARLYREGLPLRERYMTTVAMTTATLWPAFAGLAIVAKPFIIFVYGERWVSAAVLLTYLAIGSIIGVAITMAWEVCTVTGSLALQTRIEAIRAAVSLAIFMAACFISLEAAAASRILDGAIAFALYRPHLDRLTGTGLRDLGGIYLQSMLLTLASILPAALLVLATAGGVPSLPPLMIAIALGVLFWAGLLVWMRHPLSVQVIASVRHRLSWARA